MTKTELLVLLDDLESKAAKAALPPTLYCKPWGDGSSTEGFTNVLCDEMELVVIKDVPREHGEYFAAAANNLPLLIEAFKTQKLNAEVNWEVLNKLSVCKDQLEKAEAALKNACWCEQIRSWCGACLYFSEKDLPK